MTQKTLSIIALFISLLWALILFKGLPQLIYDPDGVLVVITLILLDFLLIVVGGLSATCAFRRRLSWWTTLSVLAIPAMHALGSIVESPLNLICFFSPVGVLAIITLIKWNSEVACGEKSFTSIND